MSPRAAHAPERLQLGRGDSHLARLHLRKEGERLAVRDVVVRAEQADAGMSREKAEVVPERASNARAALEADVVGGNVAGHAQTSTASTANAIAAGTASTAATRTAHVFRRLTCAPPAG